MFKSTLSSLGKLPSIVVAPIKKGVVVQQQQSGVKRRRVEEEEEGAVDVVGDITKTLTKITNKIDDVILQHKELIRYIKAHRSAMLSAVEVATYKCCESPTDTHAHVKTLSDLISSKLPVHDMYSELVQLSTLAVPLREYVRAQIDGSPQQHLRLFLRNEKAKQHVFMFLDSASIPFVSFCDKLDEFARAKVKRPKTKKDTKAFLDIFSEFGIKAEFDAKRIEKLNGLYLK